MLKFSGGCTLCSFLIIQNHNIIHKEKREATGFNNYNYFISKEHDKINTEPEHKKWNKKFNNKKNEHISC